jgi:hypothetical protein
MVVGRGGAGDCVGGSLDSHGSCAGCMMRTFALKLCYFAGVVISLPLLGAYFVWCICCVAYAAFMRDEDDALTARAKAYPLSNERLRELAETKKPPQWYFDGEEVKPW